MEGLVNGRGDLLLVCNNAIMDGTPGQGLGRRRRSE